MNLSTLLYIIALVCFVVAIFPTGVRFNLVAAGLASATLALLLGSGVLHG